MLTFVNKFRSLLDKDDKAKFIRFISLLFLSGMLSLFGIGLIIPVVNLLIDPEKIHQYSWLNSYTYSQVLISSIFLLVFAFWVKNAMLMLSLTVQSKFLYGLAAKIQKKLFSHYMNLSYSAHLYRSTPKLIRNLNNETSVFANYIVNPIGTALTEFITSSIILTILLVINFWFSFAVGLSLLLTLTFFLRFTRRKTKYFAALRADFWAAMTKQVMQGLGGIKETKLYHKEDYFLRQFDKSADNIAQSGSFSNIFRSSPRFLIEVIAITVILVLLALFILLGYSGTQILVLLSVFGVASVQLLPSLNRLMQAVAMIKYAKPAFETIYQDLKHESVHHTKKETPSLTLQFNQAIIMRNVSYGYQKNKLALENINLVIPKGKKIALVGESGAGKSTCVDVLLGLLELRSGELLVDDQLLQGEESLRAYQKLFAYIPQIIYLYDGSIRENIAFGLTSNEINDQQVWRCLQLASLADFVNGLPAGLDSMVGENGIRLSGGQRQRIGIARALYHQPEVLVMDEATAALDNQTEREVTRALYTAVENRTVVTIAHRLSTVRQYDCLYFMRQGKIISSGTFDELSHQCAGFATMLV